MNSKVISHKLLAFETQGWKTRDALINEWYFGPEGDEETTLARSLALLFMYEMGEP